MPATAATEKLDPDDLRSRQRFTRPVCTTPEEMSDDGAEGSNKRTFRKYLNHGIGLDKLLDYSHQGIKDLFRGACRTGPGRVGPRSGNEHAALRPNEFDDKKQQLTHAEDPDTEVGIAVFNIFMFFNIFVLRGFFSDGRVPGRVTDTSVQRRSLDGWTA